MPKKNRNINSKAEIANISEHGFRLYYKDNEYFLPFVEYPWFKDCKIADILNVTSDDSGNFNWPALDVDLNIEMLQNPEKYPLKSRQ